MPAKTEQPPKESSSPWKNYIIIALCLVCGMLMVLFILQQFSINDTRNTLEQKNEENAALQKNLSDKDLQVKNQQTQLSAKSAEMAVLNSSLQTQIQASKKDTALLEEFIDAEKDLNEIGKKRDSVSNSMDKMNTSSDYVTCTSYVNKLNEYNSYNDNSAKRTLLHYQTVGAYINKSSCNSRIDALKSKVEDLKDARDAYSEKADNWCYGYHKASWSYTWVEEYLTPLKLASNSLDKEVEDYNDILSNLIDICFS